MGWSNEGIQAPIMLCTWKRLYGELIVKCNTCEPSDSPLEMSGQLLKLILMRVGTPTAAVVGLPNKDVINFPNTIQV